MDLVIPDKLKKGDYVGFISPSAGLAPFAMHRIDKAKSMLEELGFKVKFAKNALKNIGYVSGTIDERTDDIHEMFEDSEVKMIMATTGGNHSNRLLKYINYDLIKNNPKIFIGYSDNTVLHFAFQSKANLATFYGPCAMTQFGEYPRILDYTLDYFKKELIEKEVKNGYDVTLSETWTDEVLDWFQKKDLERPRELFPNTGYLWLQGGFARGELWGGAIPSLNHLAGTEFWVDPKDKIFFVDIPEGNDIHKGFSISNVDSYFADLYNLGVFGKIAGLIVGRPYKYSEGEHSELQSLVLKYMGKNKCPILYNANIGHVDPITTLRYGSVVELISEANSFNVLG